MMNRRVWKTPRAGNIRRLSLESEAMGTLPDGQVRVEVKAVGLNFADVFALAGLYSATPRGGFVPGLEFSGTITDVAGDVRKLSPGDRVMGVTRFGGYATHIDQDARYCEPLPQGWSYAEGAAYPVQTLTAWYALKNLGDVRPGHNVLVQSAAGGVGLQALKICRKLGVNVLGTVGNPGKKEFLRRSGFDQIAVRKRGWPEAVLSMLNGRELDLALDAIGGKAQKECYRLLSPAGRLIVFGAAAFAPGKGRPRYAKMLVEFLARPRYDPLDLITDNKSVMGFNLIWLWDKTELLLPCLDQIRALKLDPPSIGKEFPFEEAPAAVEYLRSGVSHGKVVLTVPGP